MAKLKRVIQNPATISRPLSRPIDATANKYVTDDNKKNQYVTDDLQQDEYSWKDI